MLTPDFSILPMKRTQVWLNEDTKKKIDSCRAVFLEKSPVLLAMSKRNKKISYDFVIESLADYFLEKN
jgi:hypothetical protein